jgi:hypothetical protein
MMIYPCAVRTGDCGFTSGQPEEDPLADTTTDGRWRFGNLDGWGVAVSRFLPRKHYSSSETRRTVDVITSWGVR